MNKKLLKSFIYSILYFVFIVSVHSQQNDDLWQKSSVSEEKNAKINAFTQLPTKYDVYNLNYNLLVSKLKNAPKGVISAKKSQTVISFPNANGLLENFKVIEASVMDENLQKKHPEIRSYIGESTENKGTIIRFSVTPAGLHALFLQEKDGTVYIDPYINNSQSYMVYNTKNLHQHKSFECLTEELTETTTFKNDIGKAVNVDDSNLRTFRLAIAATAEYSQFHLNNRGISVDASDEEKKAAVLAAIVVTMTRVNALYERELAVRLVLVENNTNIIFLDETTDGFTNGDASEIINESQTVIDNLIGTPNYDIGHTFYRPVPGVSGQSGGGLAALRSVCSTGKARATTGLASPIGDFFNIDYVSHEMGHQFGANHTFNSGAGSCGGGNRNDATAVEPGSGSTIMAYSGICSPENVQDQADHYFHVISIREMWQFLTSDATCATLTPTGNNAPVIESLPNYILPVSTPFALTATATDIDGDNLTYTWEQIDNEITAVPLVSTATAGPAFRSLPPSNNNTRYFPSMETIVLNNLSNIWEVLPSVSRTMRFATNVRDNNLVGGQSAYAETELTFYAAAGPFKVTSQPSAVTWDAGTAQTITWDVANTNAAPINCSFVDILLSTDNGGAFTTTLASNVPNTGSFEIVVPNISTTNARIMVKSVGNVFFAVNAAKVSIQTSEFIMEFDSYSKSVCAPDNATYTFTYNTFLGFNEETTFTATGAPAGSTVTFNPAAATAAGTSVEMLVSGLTATELGNYTISVKGTSATIEKNTVAYLNVFSAVINQPQLLLPANNAMDIFEPIELSWNEDANATAYIVEIANDELFSTVIETATINQNNYQVQTFEPNETYYWRVKAVNNCGESDFSQVFKYIAANITCNTYNSPAGELPIPDNDALGLNSIISVSENKTISDINVTINVTHTYDADLVFTLTSPQGTKINLATNVGSDGDNFTNTTFDDEATDNINFGNAPFTGLYVPQEKLAAFNNEKSFGNWTLNIADIGAQDLGNLVNWSIAVCGMADRNFTVKTVSETCPDKNNGTISITAPIENNYTATVNGSDYQFTTVLDLDNLSPGTYNICVRVTGDTFEQCYVAVVEQGTTVSGKAEISSNRATIEILEGTAPFVVFVNGVAQFETLAPQFGLDVKHGDVIEVKTAVDCEGIFSKTIALFDEITAYPNPTQGALEIAVPSATENNVTISIYNTVGQLISAKKYEVKFGKIQLNLADKPTGLYIINIGLKQPINLKVLKN